MGLAIDDDEDPAFPFDPFEKDDEGDGFGGSADFGVADLGWREGEAGVESEFSLASVFFSLFPFDGGDGFLRIGFGRKLEAGLRLGEVYTSMLRSSSSESVSRSIVLLLNRTTG